MSDGQIFLAIVGTLLPVVIILTVVAAPLTRGPHTGRDLTRSPYPFSGMLIMVGAGWNNTPQLTDS